MSQRLHVLFIEDNHDSAAYIGRLLEQQQSATVTLEWIKELQKGLRRLAGDGFDAVLVDLQQPDSQGLDTLGQLRRANKDVPVVVLTSLEDVETAAEALRQGAQEFIVKEHLSGYLLQHSVQNSIDRMREGKALEASRQRIRESDARTRAILNASPDCIVTLNEAGVILDVNPAAERVFGYTRDELIGHEMGKRLISDAMSHRLLRNFDKYQKKGNGSMLGTRIESTARRKDGTPFVAEIATQPVPIEGALVFTVFLRDITTRRQAEEELKRYSAELERSNRDLEQYASIISHDLIAPLRAITGFCNLLQRDYHEQLDETADEFIEFIVEGARRMHALIDDLRTYSRVTTSQRPVERLDCHAIVQAVLDNLEAEILESAAEITNDSLPVVTADKSQLIQLFQNLIGNAIKYRNQESPQIHVSAKKDGDEWVLSVCDNGIGFDPVHDDRIFEIFHRLYPDEEQFPGTGIGLAICKRIVERHGGHIWSESKPGQGSTFTFTLPIEAHEKLKDVVK